METQLGETPKQVGTLESIRKLVSTRTPPLRSYQHSSVESTVEDPELSTKIL
jgi:hypothetical protein